MIDPDSLESLRGLHQDLLALEKSQLLIIERLWADLELRIDDFKKLLDKSSKNEKSRKALLLGMI
jgi:nuclear pore complex protein Nup205